MLQPVANAGQLRLLCPSQGRTLLVTPSDCMAQALQTQLHSGLAYIAEFGHESNVVRAPGLVRQSPDVTLVGQLQRGRWHQGVCCIEHVVQGARKALAHVRELQAGRDSITPWRCWWSCCLTDTMEWRAR